MKKAKDKYPEIKVNWKEFMDNINKGGEIAIVIVGAAIIDELLRRVLEYFIINRSMGKKMLGHDTKPFGTFSNRILSAYALGLINKEEFDHLTIIRKIRNEFAHNFNKASFKDQTILKLCGSLVFLKGTSFLGALSPFDKFRVVIVSYSHMLALRPTLVKSRKRFDNYLKKGKEQESP